MRFADKLRHLLPFVVVAVLLPPPVEACTRVLYTGSDRTVITGRNMDWMEDLHSDLWAFPRGMKRNGEAGKGSPEWESKYGSVVVSAYNIGSADGMNEMGLVANMLYLAEADFGTPDDKPPLSIALWAQYVLDNYATVEEAVKSLEAQPFRIVAPDLPHGKKSALHLAISDVNGDSAIFEYLGGSLVVHHGPQFRVMTNSPTYDQQLALNTYWEKIGGWNFIPGTISAADRYVRASFLLNAIPTEADPNVITAVPGGSFANQAVASVMSVMRAVSVPLGVARKDQPNLSSTLWRTVSDQKNKVYFFDSSTTPNTFWVRLGDLDLRKGAPPKKLAIAGGKYYAGNAANDFEPATPFEWLKAAK